MSAVLPTPETALNPLAKGPDPSQGYRQARTVDDLTRRNVETIRRLDQAAVEQGSAADRMAGHVAAFCGRMAFVWAHAAVFGVWIAFNTIPGLPAFDPYPFTFLILVVSLEAIFLATFVLMSQNHEMRITERRSQLALQITLLTEQENTKQLQLLQRIAERLGLEDDDPTVRALEEATRPDKLAEQIDRAYCEGQRAAK